MGCCMTFFTCFSSPHLFLTRSILSWLAFVAPSLVVLTRYFMFAVLGVVNMPHATLFLNGECPQSPSFQSSQVWTHLLRSFTCSAWKYKWRPVLALEINFNPNGIKRGPSGVLRVALNTNSLFSPGLKVSYLHYLAQLPGWVDVHVSTSTDWSLFFPKEAVVFFCHKNTQPWQ